MTTQHDTLPPERQQAYMNQLLELMLKEGFRACTLDDLAARLRCSKTTLYRLAPSKEQLVITVVKSFFRQAGQAIETTIADLQDPATRIAAYLSGVGQEMRRLSPAFYNDMVSFGPTKEIYAHNADVAANRVRDFIDEGVQHGTFRAVHAKFAGHVVALVISAIQSGELLQATEMTSGDAYSELSQLIVRGLANDNSVVDHKAPRARPR